MRQNRAPHALQTSKQNPSSKKMAGGNLGASDGNAGEKCISTIASGVPPRISSKTSRRRSPGRPKRILDPMEIVRLRDQEKLSWRRIATHTGAGSGTLRRAYAMAMAVAALTTSNPAKKRRRAFGEGPEGSFLGPQTGTS